MNEIQTCPAVGYQSASVCVPVTVTPFAQTGETVTRCCGEPVVMQGNTCAGTRNGSCVFTISQDICVSVPVAFGATAAVGEAVAAELGLDEVHAQLLPADKVARVEALLKEKRPKNTLAFVGDGINDAPVLSRADVGIAMGALGSDAAIEAADVVLMDDKPSKIAMAIRIARRTRRIVFQNIVFALAVKLLVLFLGATGDATMWEAVFADVGVSVIAILNATRALKIK